MGIDDRGLWGAIRSQIGLIWKNFDHLWYGSVITSYDENTIATAASQNDYITSPEGWVDYNEPGEDADEEITVIYEDGVDWHPGKIQVKQESYMWENDPLLLVEYTFVNIGGDVLTDIYFGQFMDFDVEKWSTNMGAWDNNQDLGFAVMYNAESENSPFIGMAMFDDSGNNANSALTFMTGIAPDGGSENYISGLMRNQIIQQETDYMADYSMLMSAGPYDLNSGQSISPFYLVIAAGDNLQAVRDAVQLAYQRMKIISDIEHSNSILPDGYSLSQNYPNPFNPTTTIKYSIPAYNRQSSVSSKQNQSFNQQISKSNDVFVLVQIKVYDILGREIATLVNEQQQPGNYEVKWDARGQTSGVYIYSIEVNNFKDSKKMLLIK
jgi:hypothetical protein